jgi:hypothetical protein
LLLAAAALYRRLLAPSWLATFALCLYAIDDTHGATISWIANRNALIATLFGLLAILAHDRYRRDRPTRVYAALGPCLLLIGMLAGKAALATCAYLFSYALFLDPEGRRAGMRSLLPY